MGHARLTRRSLLEATFAGGGALALPGVAQALMAPPAGRVFSLAVDRLGGHAVAGGWIVGAPLRAPGRFDLVGVEWSTPAAARVSLRVLRAGRWSRWASAGAHGHGPDDAAAASGSVIGDPVWAGGADAVQLRASSELRGVVLHFVNSTGTATAAERALRGLVGPLVWAGRGRGGSARGAAAQAPQLLPAIYDAGPGQPPIIARSSWADASCRPRLPTRFGTVRFAVVHHTENANGYAPSESAAMVRAICQFHIYTRGWGDMGYNLLVDRYGQIFEGRAGGVDEAIVGAQAGGFNYVSTGIGMLGSFQGVAPSRAALRALQRLIAWKLSLHGVPTRGIITVHVSRSGASYSPYRPGTPVRVRRISGHRDVDSTTCPGDALYGLLPVLRRRAERLAGKIAALTIVVPPDGATYLQPAPVSGRLTFSDGTPIPGATVAVQVREGRGERVVATAVTDQDGAWSAAAQTPAKNSKLRAAFAGDGSRPAVLSADAALVVGPAVSVVVGAAPAVVGQAVALSGSLDPPKRAVDVAIASVARDGSTTKVAELHVAASGGEFATSYSFPAAGNYLVVAHTRPDPVNAVGTSPAVGVKVVAA